MLKTYLFTGEEGFLLHQEITKRKENFKKKYGPDTVVSLSLGENSGEEILQTLSNSGLFSENKLIIISGMPGETTSPKGTAELEEKIIAQRSHINPDYFVIFISKKPDKRKKAFKFFVANCESKTFSPMDMRVLPSFIQQAYQEGLTKDNVKTPLQRDHIDLIIELVGKDAGRLHNECQKLASYVNTGKTINENTIKSIITPSQESTAFELNDGIIERNSEKILTSIQKLSEKGEPRQAIQGGLLWGLKQMIAYGIVTSQGGDTKTLGLAPFVSGKYNKYKDNLTTHLPSYILLYEGLLEFDYQVKSGKLSDTGYRLSMKEKLFEGGFL